MNKNKKIGILVHPGWNLARTNSVYDYRAYEQFLNQYGINIVLLPKAGHDVISFIIREYGRDIISSVLKKEPLTDMLEVLLDKSSILVDGSETTYPELFVNYGKKLLLETSKKYTVGKLSFKLVSKKPIEARIDEIYDNMIECMDVDLNFIQDMFDDTGIPNEEYELLLEWVSSISGVHFIKAGNIALASTVIDAALGDMSYAKLANIEIYGEYYQECVSRLSDDLIEMGYTNISTIPSQSVSVTIVDEYLKEKLVVDDSKEYLFNAYDYRPTDVVKCTL